MDRFEGVQDTTPSLHKYTYAYNNPLNAGDPNGLFTQAFGELAHALIAGRYLAQYPGTIINPTTGVLSALKPDILDGIRRKYAEIKPLSFPGIFYGWLQIESYDRVYQFLDFKRQVVWPGGIQAIYVAGDPIVYFNVEGIIFYTDAVDAIKDLKTIRDKSSAYRVLRNLITRGLSGVVRYIRGLARGVVAQKSADIEETEGIAAVNSELGAP